MAALHCYMRFCSPTVPDNLFKDFVFNRIPSEYSLQQREAIISQAMQEMVVRGGENNASQFPVDDQRRRELMKSHVMHKSVYPQQISNYQELLQRIQRSHANSEVILKQIQNELDVGEALEKENVNIYLKELTLALSNETKIFTKFFLIVSKCFQLLTILRDQEQGALHGDVHLQDVKVKMQDLNQFVTSILRTLHPVDGKESTNQLLSNLVLTVSQLMHK